MPPGKRRWRSSLLSWRGADCCSPTTQGRCIWPWACRFRSLICRSVMWIFRRPVRTGWAIGFCSRISSARPAVLTRSARITLVRSACRSTWSPMSCSMWWDRGQCLWPCRAIVCIDRASTRINWAVLNSSRVAKMQRWPGMRPSGVAAGMSRSPAGQAGCRH